MVHILQQIQLKTKIVIESYITGYPEGRSESLIEFLKICHKGKHKIHHNKTWKNLATSERNTLRRLANEYSIVIKMTNERVAIVIRNKEEYISSCKEVLRDKDFYEEIKICPTIITEKARQDNF